MKKIMFITVSVIMILAGSPQAYNMGGVDIHGFVSQGYLCSDDNKYMANTEGGTTEFNEFGINFLSRITGKLTVGLQFFARDLGDYGNDDLKLDWAMISYGWKQWLGLRAGNLKIPMGFYNDTRDLDAARVSILLPQSIYNETSRDISAGLQGAGIYGNIPLGFMGNANYQLLFGRMDTEGENSGLYAFFRAQAQTGVTAIDMDDVFVSSLIWETSLDRLSFVDGFRLGWSYMQTSMEMDSSLTVNFAINEATGMLVVPDGMGGWTPFPAPPGVQPDYYFHVYYDTDIDVDMIYDVDNFDKNVYSVEYVYKNLTLAYEHQFTGIDISIFIDTGEEFEVFEYGGRPMLNFHYTNEAYYVSAAYRFCEWFEMGVYCSFSYYDKDDKDGEGLYELDTAETDRIMGADAWLYDDCVSLRFDLNENWTMKLEYHAMDGLFSVEPDDDGNTDKNWHMYAAKMSVSF